MKITTKTGDRGKTGLFGGRRVSKASMFIEMVGQLDELQSYVGWARCAVVDAGSGAAVSMAAILDRVQDDLYRMMADVGAITEKDVMFLEKYIVEAQDLVKDLSEFIRPGSTEVAARLHIARTVCRRVERRMVAVGIGWQEVGVDGGLKAQGRQAAELMLKYLNRLSDLLFVLAYKFEKK